MAVSTAVQDTTSCALPAGATPTPITCARSGTGGGGGTLGVPVIWPPRAGASVAASSGSAIDVGTVYASVTVAPAGWRIV